MITCRLVGGLGNQLFQIFTTISYAIKHKQMFKFEYADILTIGVPRPTYWNSFLSKLKPFTFSKHDVSTQTNNVIKEQGFHYTELPWSDILHNTHVILVGYFQSHKYFSIFYNTICRMIDLENQKLNIVSKYRHYFETNSEDVGEVGCEVGCEFEKFIGIHFRLGDYKNNPDIHLILNKEYYEKAILYVMAETEKKNWKILYFCEEESNKEVEETIEYLKKRCSRCEFIKVPDTIPDWEQLLLMSCCTHNIIANSTFSWWGAYLNTNPNKIVCYPNKWFGQSMPNHKTLFTTDDLFPSTWMMIE
uniref:Glycosyltransferase n=1 Tax=viral metagenome TaxID=1070528 RepID=A0A6C0EEI4_9ZZZZ